MSIAVRSLEPADMPRFYELIDGLADYEKLVRPDAGARARLARDAFSQPPRFRALLGEHDGQPVGYAMFFFTYSSFRGQPSLYLEDLFVSPSARGRGVGIALFRAVAAEAIHHACGRMEWQVLSWNQPSIDFYERLGAKHLEGWLPFRLDGEALQRVAQTSSRV